MHGSVVWSSPRWKQMVRSLSYNIQPCFIMIFLREDYVLVTSLLLLNNSTVEFIFVYLASGQL